MRKKRPNGEGSITYDKARNSYRVFIVAPDGRRVTKRFKNEHDAIEWKTAQLHSIHTGTFVAPSVITIGEWAVEWLQTYKKGNVKQRTFETYLSEVRHLAPIAHIVLQEVTAPLIQKFYPELIAGGLSPHTTHKVHKQLKDMFKKAHALGMIQKNIMEHVEAPKFESKEVEIFTRQEIERIFLVCYEKFRRYYPIFRLLLDTGARKGEILGLRWMDVLPSEITIRQSLQESAVFGPYIETPKTKASIRKISITPEDIQIMNELRQSLPVIDIEKKQLCFLTSHSTPFRPCNIDRVWKRLLESAGIPHKKMHTLRHTHATELLAAGVPIIEVARRLGHSKISHTLELYGHAIPNYDQKIAGTVQGFYCLPGGK